MNERINRVLEKMNEKGIDQLLVSDPLSIRFLTGIMVNPGERLYALLLRTSGKHTLFLNYLYYVSNTGFEEVWFSDMDDQIGGSDGAHRIQRVLLELTRHGRLVSSFHFRSAA